MCRHLLLSGELVCFFRAPPRILRNVLRGLSTSSANPSQNSLQDPETGPRLFQSPALISDAVRRLGLAATDRLVKPSGTRRTGDGNNIPRIINLLTFSQQKLRRESESKTLGDIPRNFSLLPTRRSTVLITNTTNIAGADRKVAVDYVFQSDSLADVCEKNALVAREHGRYDHERVFRTLGTLFPSSREDGTDRRPFWSSVSPNSLVRRVVTLLWVQLFFREVLASNEKPTTP